MKKIIRLIYILLTAATLVCCSTQNKPSENAASRSQSLAEISASDKESAAFKTNEPKETVKEPCNGEHTEVEDIAASPSNNGKLSVNGADLIGENGNSVRLKGISTHGIAWFPDYINQRCFDELKEDFGANLVRLAMYTAESGGYCTDGYKEELKALVKNGVNYAKNADMYAIIDWHTLSDNDPNTYKDEAVKFFDEMSREFAGYNNVIYEICNEPNGDVTWQQIKSYAEEVIPAIRANDPDAVILVGTPNWSQYIDEAAKDPLDFENIMYTVHYYAATHKEDLRVRVKKAYEGGLPVFISEYGICDASGNGGVDYEQAALWANLADELNLSSAMWNLSNKDETSAIIKPDCDKNSSFTEEDLSDAGIWFLSMMSGELPEKEENASSESEEKSGASGGQEFTGKTNALDITVKTANIWEENGAPVTQYDLTVNNNGGDRINGWSVKITFDGEFTLKDGWNGTYGVSDGYLTIKNADYNGALESGEQISDIGFIISGDVKIVNVN